MERAWADHLTYRDLHRRCPKHSARKQPLTLTTWMQQEKSSLKPVAHSSCGSCTGLAWMSTLGGLLRGYVTPCFASLCIITSRLAASRLRQQFQHCFSPSELHPFQREPWLPFLPLPKSWSTCCASSRCFAVIPESLFQMNAILLN